MIARALGRAPSTVSRELARGTVRRKSGYRASGARFWLTRGPVVADSFMAAAFGEERYELRLRQDGAACRVERSRRDRLYCIWWRCRPKRMISDRGRHGLSYGAYALVGRCRSVLSKLQRNGAWQ